MIDFEKQCQTLAASRFLNKIDRDSKSGVGVAVGDCMQILRHGESMSFIGRRVDWYWKLRLGLHL